MSYIHLLNFMNSQSTWDNAKAFLTADYKLRIVDPPSSDYAIVRYVNDSSDFGASPLVGEARSVVIHKPTAKIVSVAPPKATPYSAWDHSKTTIAQEFIDGTMINIFRCADGSINSASRSRIGSAKTKFSPKTFQEMIDEALSITPIKHYRDLLPEGWMSASIVFQHRDNRIVCPVVLPRVYIVALTRLGEDGTITTVRDPAEWPETHRIYAVPTYDLAAVGGSKDAVDTYVNMKALSLKHAWQGVVLYNAEGERTKLRGIFYESVKQIRGNDGSMEDRYARLRTSRMVKKYIEYFPEDQDEFFRLEGVLRAHTKDLYEAYVETNITKTKAYTDLPWPYKYHVGKLHRRFVETLRSLKQKINFEYIINYVNGLGAEDMGHIIRGPVANAA
jgi:hypothetical protein